MAVNIRKFLAGIGLIPVGSSAISVQGEMEVLSADGRIYWHDGSVKQKIAGIATADTLSNKTISDASNTLSVATGSISGQIAIAQGGTGAATQQTAINALTGSQSSGKYLRSDGTNASLTTIQAGDVPTLNQNTSGTAAGLSATLVVASGGTGQVSLTAHDVLVGNGTSAVTQVAPSSTSGVPLISNGSSADPSFGTAAIAGGGTGQTTKTAAFDALSPNTTKGDITLFNGTNNVRQAVGTDGFILSSDSSQTNGVKWIQLSGTGSSKAVAQTSHGFSVGNALYYTGTAYALAKADADSTSEVVGIVSAVADANNFTITIIGYITGLTSLTAGTTYYLSDSSAGALTATEPTTVGHISKPLFVADSTTTGYLINMRGVLITANTGVLGLAGALVQVHSTGWSVANSTSYSVFAATGTVSSFTATSGSTTASLPTTVIPGIKLASIPAGTYKVTATGRFGLGTGGNETSYFSFYDGTNYGQSNGILNLNAGSVDAAMGGVVSYFTYSSSQSNIIFQIAARGESTTGANTVAGSGLKELAIIVERIY